MLTALQPQEVQLLDIWELLDDGKRVIVYSNGREGLLVTWTQEAGWLVLWSLQPQSRSHGKILVGYKTLTERRIARSAQFDQAVRAARAWMSEFIEPR